MAVARLLTRAGADLAAWMGPDVPAPRHDGARQDADDDRRWVKIDFEQAEPAGKWIQLRYRTSFYDRLERPLIRFRTHDGVVEAPLAAALFGSAQWIGLAPATTNLVAVSSTGSLERSDFAIERCRTLTLADLARQAVEADAWRAVRTSAVPLLTSPDRARQALAIEAGCYPLRRYHEWRARHLRPLDIAGLDRPRHDWSNGLHVRYVCRKTSSNLPEVQATRRSLEKQAYPNWSLVLLSEGEGGLCPVDGCQKILSASPDAAPSELLGGLGQAAVLAPIVAGSQAPDYATAVLAEFAAANPHHDLLYADEDEVDAQGRYSNPRLKPDWSPCLQRHASYVADALFVRASAVERSGMTADQLSQPRFVASLFDRAAACRVGHVRRVLLTRESARVDGARLTRHRPSPSPSRVEATIVIPTKDRADLLASCIAGLKNARSADIEVVIVDNGSQERRTAELYESLSTDRRFRIVHAPGPFNFAQLCNDGAREARSSALLFLNNDIVPLDDDWLGHLVPWVYEDTVGAVGARLLYPSGRLQHGGMVLGLKGNAGHVGIGDAGDSVGYLGRLAGPHEVMAVTGACLAVERRKFESVGGFDADCFPVELNDVDLCLRLKARGWSSLVAPACRLIHHESATRGRTRSSPARYPREHDAFRRRWGAAIYDDPYFHPALALTSTQAALG